MECSQAGSKIPQGCYLKSALTLKVMRIYTRATQLTRSLAGSHPFCSVSSGRNDKVARRHMELDEKCPAGFQYRVKDLRQEMKKRTEARAWEERDSFAKVGLPGCSGANCSSPPNFVPRWKEAAAPNESYRWLNQSPPNPHTPDHPLLGIGNEN